MSLLAIIMFVRAGGTEKDINDEFYEPFAERFKINDCAGLDMSYI